MRFIFEEVIYEFIVLPFGLACSPKRFRTLTRLVSKLGSSRGIRAIFQINDILVLGSSFEDCQERVRWLYDLLVHLGFIINHRRSDLVPSQRFRFLGLIWDTIQMRMGLTMERVIKIRNIAQVVVDNPIITYLQAMKLQESVISAVHGVPYAKAGGGELQRFILAIDLSDNDYSKKIHVSEKLRKEA